MRKKISLKSYILIGFVAFAVGFLPFFGAIANASSKPSIREVSGREDTQLKLPVKYEKYASKRVKIKLYTKNLVTGEIRETTHNRKLDGDGQVTLKVRDLNPGTLYEFRVKIRKESGGNYSDKSSKREGSTRLLGLN